MHLFIIFWIFNFTIIYKSDALLGIIGRKYQYMSYSPIKSLLTNYNIRSEKRCIAQCAQLVSTCNIAVFNPVISPNCALYGESLTITNLIPSINTTVVDFRRNNSNEVLGCLPVAGITSLSSYNLITLGDLTIVSGVQNRTIICGSLVSSSSTDFGKTINPVTFPPATYTLELNGQIVSGNTVQVLAGSLGIGTSSAHTIVPTNNVSYTLDGRTVLIQSGNQGGAIRSYPNLTAKCTAITNDVIALSSKLATLVNNITANNMSIPTSVAAPLTFFVNKLDANGMAVFNISGNTAFNNPLVQVIQIIVNANITNDVQLIVINLSGTSISFSQGNMGGTWLSSSTLGQPRTIWNFYQATSISITRAWLGALLAPYAAVTSNVNIAGSTVVQSLNTNAEVDNPPINMPSCV